MTANQETNSNNVNVVTFHNLTPHAITVYDANGENVLFVIEPSGETFRLASKRVPVMQLTHDGHSVPVHKTEFYVDDTELAKLKKGAVNIVSTLALSAIKETHPELFDEYIIVAPDTSPASAVRDDTGKIVGVRGFQVV